MKKRVVVGLSGGVDSAVALIELIKDGYEVIAVFMRNWDSFVNDDILGNPTINDSVCSQEKDYIDAKKVACQFNVPFYRIDFIKEYWDEVFTYFIDEYKKGRTPNPDILCNTEIKFKAFFKYAMSLDVDYIAMGHYAKLNLENGVKVLAKPKDVNKDQTYFLSQLTSSQLQKVLFPLADLTKKEVRQIAKKHNLVDIAQKKDSTGICFIGERKFNAFLSNYILAQKGPIKLLDGTYIKDHSGLMYYTIGQRKGLAIGGLKAYEQQAWYVIGKDIKTNTLYVGQGLENDYLYSNRCVVRDVIFRGSKDVENKVFGAIFRYRQKEVVVSLKWLDETSLEVVYHNKVRAVTPGQAAAFYDGEVCIGGGFIDEVYFDNEKRKY